MRNSSFDNSNEWSVNAWKLARRGDGQMCRCGNINPETVLLRA